MNDREKYLAAVLKLLSIRPRSKKEITEYLSRKHLSDDLINQITAYLEQYKLIDDAEFARWLVESRSRSRPRGLRLLKQELKSKGISAADIDVDEPALALQALQKKLPLWKKLPYRDYRLKAGRYLASRGFSWDVIDRVVKQSHDD